MTYQLEEIQKDIRELDVRQFYMKHIVRSDNWYFENILQIPTKNILAFTDDFKFIISENLKISFNSIMMVGSGKTGYSLSPTKEKLYKGFNLDSSIRNVSDLDVAIISAELFNKYWDLFRKSFKHQYINTYKHLKVEIYRGYINEHHLNIVDGCWREWNCCSSDTKKKLHSNLYIKSDISFRIYRNWEDFEEYNIQSLNKIKGGLI